LKEAGEAPEMRSPSAAFIELLAGKTPEAIYDALHARRYLSAAALASPGEVVAAVKTTMLTHHQRMLTPPRKVELVGQTLAARGYLSSDGLRLYNGEELAP
jgi:hypothetical protein